MALRGLILGFCLVNIAQILAIEPSSDTYDEMYSRARDAYRSQSWPECVKQINDALKDYKFYRSTLITCRRECRGNVINENETSVTPELENMIPFFFKIIKVSNCVRICKQKNMPNRPDVAVHLDVEDDFEMRMPYDYLQFCHYKATKINYYTTPTLQPYCPTHQMKETCTHKMDNVKEAVAAAYTYLMADAKQDTTVQNLMFYQQFPEVDTSDFIDLERRPYQTAFINGQENQRNGDWQEGIKYIEEAINEFIKEEEDCRILCEGPYDHESFPEFINAISEHYISVLKCQDKCEEKLSLLYGEKVKDFFPEMYNYLQFGYYKLNDIPNAVKATASYLLLKPEDPTMLENKRIYIKSGITPENIIPRPEALKYFTHTKQIKNILQYVAEKYVSAVDDEGEVDDSLKSIDLDSVDPLNYKRLSESHYLHIFEKYGLRIMAEPNDLFEPYRLVVDGFIGDEQCQEMVNLVTLQKTVDGMKTLTVPETVEKMNVSDDYNVGLRLLLRISGIAKQFIQKYLNHNIFHYSTKVICKDKWNGNCFFTESGKCLSEFVPEGSFQSITHLSSIPKAGGSYFAKPEEIIIRPKCGRMILFRSTDPLGMKPFNESEMQRCVLWNVFGNVPMQDEIDHLDALILLRNMDEQVMLNTSENRNQVLNDLLNQGVEVVSTEKEMLGKERFIADGLASQAECETLIDLANDGSVRGDGYKHQQGILSIISPHTKHELFQGLTVARAAKLVKEGTVSFDAVSLLLKLAEKGRLLVEKYLNLTKPLYFDFTHLVCRTAVDEDELDRNDLSHPIHADNCLLQPDGTCLKEVPAYIQRDYSAIIYLNGEFTGGEFIFAYPNKSEQLSMKPKCGRLVGFNAADYHGVKAVIKGQRCCLAMWYTQDPDFKELAHSQAYKILKQVEKEREESEKSSSDSADNDIEKDQPNSSDSSTDISSKEKNTDSISNKNEEL